MPILILETAERPASFAEGRTRRRSRGPGGGVRSLPALSSSAGFTLVEATVAILVLFAVLVPLGQIFVSSTNAFSSLARRAHLTARAPVVLDRIVEEMSNGRFTSLDPPVPTDSTWIRFQKIVDVVNDVAVFGNPIHIELIPLESSGTDNVDNDGDGFVDEGGVRIWEDISPWSTTPGVEDSPSVIATNVAKDGLRFTREGACIAVELAFEFVAEEGGPPVIHRLQSGVVMRNNY